MTGPYPGIPITQLTIKTEVGTSAYGVIVDDGPGLFLLSEEGSGSSCSCILEAPVVTPVYISDLVPIVRGGTVYLATVLDFLNAQQATPTVPYLNFSIASNSMYIGVL